ncbi:MAG: PAS domain S-box protein [Ramlibacter sp.]|nr:PAS domain S-box protein [Ramlibacter sp.]
MNRAFGLRAALTLLVLIAIAPVFAVVFQASLAEQSARIDRAESVVRSVVDLGAAQQESLVEGARQMLAAIAYAPPVVGDDVEACAAYMKKLQPHYPASYGSFGLLDAAGSLTCRATPPPASVNSSDRSFFRSAVQTGRFSVGEYTVSRANGRPVLPFGLPVYRDDGVTLRGVTYLALDVSQAEDRLRRMTLTPETTLVVADHNGRVLASVGARKIEIGSLLAEPFVQRAMASQAADYGRATGADGQEWVFAIKPVGRADERKLFVGGMASRADLLAGAESRLTAQMVALLLIAVLAAVAAWIFGDRVFARPVRRLLDRVDALADDEMRMSAPASGSSLRELGALDKRFTVVARRLNEQALQRDAAMAEMTHQRHLLESVFDGMAEGVFVVDLKGRMLHKNAAAGAILEGLHDASSRGSFLRADMGTLGVYLLDGVTLLLAENRPVARALRGEAVEYFCYLVRGSLTAGLEKIVQGSARPLLGMDGRISGAVVVYFDVTQAWHAEQELRDSESRYRTLFESNPHPMWLFDRETLRFLTVNDAAVSHYGYSREEFLSMSIADIRPVGDLPALREKLDSIDTMGRSHTWRHRLKSGELIWVEVSSHTMEYDGHPARLVLAHDVTKLLEAQQALQEANESLERRVDERTVELKVANSELESFAYSVSHDLRAPLAAIDGFGRALLAQHASSLDKKGHHYLNRIRENTRSMGDLIDDLLSLARVTRTEINAEPLDLAGKAGQIVERLRQRDPLREVSVVIDTAITCQGDARLLGIVLENLVENAWKYTSHTPQAIIHVGSRMSENGEKVIFVADNGAGFDMVYAGKLFNAFHRLHTATDFEGTGIGLATVHRIITRHGGRVWADASPGKGATFQFTLSTASSS